MVDQKIDHEIRGITRHWLTQSVDCRKSRTVLVLEAVQRRADNRAIDALPYSYREAMEQSPRRTHCTAAAGSRQSRRWIAARVGLKGNVVDILSLTCFPRAVAYHVRKKTAWNQERDCPTKAKTTLTQTSKLMVTTTEYREAVHVDNSHCYCIVVVIVVG